MSKILPGAAVFLLLAACHFQSNHLHAQGTAFTYQGRLSSGGSPASGSYDVAFRLYQTNVDGALLAGPVTKAAVGVTNGLFTTLVDFGNAFTGSSNWLELAVCSSGASPFITLAPRQLLTPVPYALVAGNISGVLAASSLPAGVVTNGAHISGAFVGDGAAVTNVNAATLGGLTGAGFWNTNGNAGANPANGAFLGTADNLPLEVRVNNTRALRLEPTTNTPNVIAGSAMNFAAPGVYGATIAGGGTPAYPGGTGLTNQVLGNFATIGGGAGNLASGNRNVGNGDSATVAGGWANQALGNNGVVGGGAGNVNQGDYGVIAGGGYNMNVSSTYTTAATIGGGYGNTVRTSFGTIAGGWNNAMQSFSQRSAIGGGDSNTIDSNSPAATIAGGYLNHISTNSAYATIPGGYGNVAAANYATAFGLSTKASGLYSTAMGRQTTAANDDATAMGFGTVASGWDTLAFGTYTLASGNYATAGGFYAQATNQSSFVWADSTSSDPFASTQDHEFSLRAQNGVRIQSDVGLHLNAADRPLIVRDWDLFAPNAPSYKAGIGRWGLFMEPAFLTLGIPAEDANGRFFQVAKYATNGAYTTLMSVDQFGNVTARSFNLSVGSGSAASLRLNDNPLYFRGGGDINHGLAYSGGSVTNFGTGNFQVDGPVLFGYGGGVLATRVGGDKAVLTWTNGSVGIGTNSPQATLDVNGSLRIGRGTVFSRVQDGIFNAGAAGTNYNLIGGNTFYTKTVTNAFPTAFSTVPNLTVSAVNQAGTDWPDVYSVTVRRVTTTNMVVNIQRLDATAGWSQILRVSYHAWE